jgi:hypothetical protein
MPNNNKLTTMYNANGLPNQEKKGQTGLSVYQVLKNIWPYPFKPTKFVGYNICSCSQQHISPLLKQQLSVVVVVVCLKASYSSTPRMGTGPAYTGIQLFLVALAIFTAQQYH